MKKPTIKQLDTLWAKVIKARAGHRSEYSLKEGILHAHHINGKPTHRMRWELKNGVCITGGEHKFIAHRADRMAEFRRWAMTIRGLTETQARMWSNQNLGGTDRFAVYLYLKNQLKKYGG